MFLALLGALAIGLSLGLLGSGGSILTVPILVYLLGQPEKLAIAGSLAIVGGIALAGALPWTLKRQIDLRSLLWFGLPGMAGTWLGAWASQWFSGAAQLALFAVVMLLAAVMMFRSPPMREAAGEPPRRRLAIVGDGLGVGAITGLVGVGGGFLIVPALVLLGRLTMQKAIGTSLWIIAMKSFSGFIGYLPVLEKQGLQLDWHLIGLFIAIGAAGTLLGMQLASRLPQQTLKRAFAMFLVLMGVYIILRTAPRLF
jgi:uncharacterized membrane protein YfcA